MTRNRLTRAGARSVFAALAVVAAMAVAMVPAASAHQGHSSAPGKLPPSHASSGHHHGAPGHHHGAPGHHHLAPGHAGHVGAPGR